MAHLSERPAECSRLQPQAELLGPRLSEGDQLQTQPEIWQDGGFGPCPSSQGQSWLHIPEGVTGLWAGSLFVPGSEPELWVCVQMMRQDPWTGAASLAVVARTVKKRWLVRLNSVGHTSSYCESGKSSRKIQEGDSFDQLTCFNEVLVL